jgi:hypothetical protein
LNFAVPVGAARATGDRRQTGEDQLGEFAADPLN